MCPKIDGDAGCVSGIVEGIVAAAAIHRAVHRGGIGEIESVAPGAAGQVLEVGETDAGVHGPLVQAVDAPGVRGRKAGDGVDSAPAIHRDLAAQVHRIDHRTVYRHGIRAIPRIQTRNRVGVERHRHRPEGRNGIDAPDIHRACAQALHFDLIRRGGRDHRQVHRRLDPGIGGGGHAIALDGTGCAVRARQKGERLGTGVGLQLDFKGVRVAGPSRDRTAQSAPGRKHKVVHPACSAREILNVAEIDIRPDRPRIGSRDIPGVVGNGANDFVRATRPVDGEGGSSDRPQLGKVNPVIVGAGRHGEICQPRGRQIPDERNDIAGAAGRVVGGGVDDHVGVVAEGDGFKRNPAACSRYPVLTGSG